MTACEYRLPMFGCLATRRHPRSGDPISCAQFLGSTPSRLHLQAFPFSHMQEHCTLAITWTFLQYLCKIHNMSDIREDVVFF